ncbi:hypothetical protein B0H14DRAFT_3547875 [Mycena olivaceomarginata]|nr:hypothetical protein B0H14DRAFT_3547875 [Mycena olivaceomarginata]
MTGCFSWFSRRARNDSRPSMQTLATRRTSHQREQATPTNTAYTMSGLRKLAETVDSVASFVPVPLVSELVKAAIVVIEAWSVGNLQIRVHQITLRIVDAVGVRDSVSKELQARIKDLESTLKDIVNDLAEIKRQKRLWLTIFRDINKERVDDCLTRINEALEQFHITSEISAEVLLERIKLQNRAGHWRAINEINKPHSAPTTLTRQDMPSRRERIHGRQSIVEDIASLLGNEATSRVCIFGPGGMGKTNLLLAVVDRTDANKTFHQEHRFWIPCIEAKSADLLRRIIYTQLRITADSYDTLEPLIKELDSSKERRILLLHRFEIPWLSHDQDEVRNILAQLAKLSHVSLLVTMTSSFPRDVNIKWQQRELSALDVEAARSLFKEQYPNVAEVPKLDDLLNAIGCMPLAIVLMANLGNKLQLSPERLLDQWRKLGTEMISQGTSALGSMDQTISMSMKEVASQPEASDLLAILSMLPAGTIGRDLVERWARNLKSPITALEALRNVGFVEQGKGDFETSRISVLPTIQAYMTHRDRISKEIRQQVHDACYDFLLDHKSIPDDPKFKDDIQALALEEINIQGLLRQINAENSSPKALDALIDFSLYHHTTKLSTGAAQHALDVATAVKDNRHIAESHRCLGKISLRLDRYDDACDHLKKARALYKSSEARNLVRAGQCSMDLAETLMLMDNKLEARDAVLEANEYLSHHGNEYHTARGCLIHGHFLWWNGEYDKALSLLESAKRIFKKLNRPSSTSECLLFIARTHVSRKEYAKALPIATKAVSEAERAGDKRREAQSLQNIAISLICSGSHDEAVGIIEQALSAAHAVGSPLGIAQNMELHGYNCAARIHIAGARAAYETAQKHFTDLAAGKGGEFRCANNLTKLHNLNRRDQAAFSALEKSPLLQ